jgi:hypothetical protein
MLIMLSDTDGDDVAVEASAIVAVTVGRRDRPMRVNGANDRRDPHEVTLVHTTAGPIVVSQTLQAVVEAWHAALYAEHALAARTIRDLRGRDARGKPEARAASESR